MGEVRRGQHSYPRHSPPARATRGTRAQAVVGGPRRRVAEAGGRRGRRAAELSGSTGEHSSMRLDVRQPGLRRRLVWLVRSIPVALLIAVFVRTAAAQGDTLASTLRPARLFSDGVVLQRGVAIPVWGWAPP